MPDVFLNRIATALPPHDVHAAFVDYVPSLLASDRERAMFARMVSRAQIAHRYSCLPPSPSPDRLDDEGFYPAGAFPGTAARMQRYEREALPLAARAVAGLGDELRGVSHLIVTSCTGFYAPGLDIELARRFDLSLDLERSVVGFMGCYAAINGLKLARHIVRSDPSARVLMVSLELCTLHLQEDRTLEPLLSYLLFADGCAAALVSAEPAGLRIDGFHAALLPGPELITWHVGEHGFRMLLSGQVPGRLLAALPGQLDAMLAGRPTTDVRHWAVHPGGRSILDAVVEAAGLPEATVEPSRRVLREHGNMSSATLLFVLRAMLEKDEPGPGCAMAFGPGLTLESMRFAHLGR